MSFERRIGELLKDEDPYAVGPDPVVIIAGARRRRARRRAGTGAAVVAVAVVCGVTAVTAGNARHAGRIAGETGAAAARSAATAAGAPAVPARTAPTPTGLPLSPVKRVAAKEKVEVVPGIRLSVTPTQDCQDTVEPATGVYGRTACTDVLSAPGMPYDRPGITLAYNETADRLVVHSYYRGPTPARIVLFVGGRPTVATLLTTPGMQGWISYYGDLPRADLRTGRVQAVPAVGAYDAAGKLLAGSPGQAADGAAEKPPAML